MKLQRVCILCLWALCTLSVKAQITNAIREIFHTESDSAVVVDTTVAVPNPNLSLVNQLQQSLEEAKQSEVQLQQSLEEAKLNEANLSPSA